MAFITNSMCLPFRNLTFSFTLCDYNYATNKIREKTILTDKKDRRQYRYEGAHKSVVYTTRIICNRIDWIAATMWEVRTNPTHRRIICEVKSVKTCILYDSCLNLRNIATPKI